MRLAATMVVLALYTFCAPARADEDELAGKWLIEQIRDAGAFDAALALTPKWDWDVAAGCLIAEEAGAKVSDHHGRPWRFNRPDPRQASLVCAAPALQPLIVQRCKNVPLSL